ncbi:Restriction endonuclease type II-like,YqaJ viral recombinase,Exonuclease, phage-type/RecB, C- [Cinara cedri]|uniref:Restriction endonuclease type II-like,YqaJ viral recombinase,Exonuclease, phage-type/RecB, C n=1 Tax=Cinara cedri TaxID=506608 RepID=A0A5E4MCX2_9HEMI|nr:Restriction endonuclease type II-like,YqaJ viral recombinase,Exonuclease, phage-type/RecB, C- [Cinara cedri]
MIENNETSRNFLGGEQVLNSNQVILCGKIQLENDPNMIIKCLVIQSSNISEMLHEVTCKLSKVKINEVSFKLAKQNLANIQLHYIKCQWNRLKQPSLKQYKPLPINNLFCLNKLLSYVLGDFVINFIRNEFIKVAKKSSLAVHARGRTYTLDINDENLNSTVRSDDEWATKFSKYFWSLPLSNKFVEHGIQYELTARELYIQNTEYVVVLRGLISSDKVPWIGYSPEGVILNNDKIPIKMLEIKCPFKGSSMGLIDLLNNLNYIVKGIEGQWLLKKKHAYCCQIQLGMLV